MCKKDVIVLKKNQEVVMLQKGDMINSVIAEVVAVPKDTIEPHKCDCGDDCKCECSDIISEAKAHAKEFKDNLGPVLDDITIKELVKPVYAHAIFAINESTYIPMNKKREVTKTYIKAITPFIEESIGRELTDREINDYSQVCPKSVYNIFKGVSYEEIMNKCSTLYSVIRHYNIGVEDILSDRMIGELCGAFIHEFDKIEKVSSNLIYYTMMMDIIFGVYTIL